MSIKQTQGKKNRAAGQRFEARVRKDLEKKGWIIDKWSNNVDLEKKKLIPAKRRYNPFMRALSIGTGFPDFICFRPFGEDIPIQGVEVKSNGYLKKEEKEKCQWLVENNIFALIIIASKGKKRGEIIYQEWK